ncbi:glycosyltransferase [Nocardia cyriacigeorgica]|uniref:glycosyltransferase n=1 Tax=Nocardia cyriacigeorgica TaxID=135487 RepID=UPI00245821EE|nr:glycosyltransferase [Nocardia cyriacigeorgica]
MRIGLIARAENTGLGTQTWEFARHMHPTKTLVVDLATSRGRQLYPERFPGAKIVQGLPDRAHLDEFVDGLDVVFTCETPYNYDLFTLTRAAGVGSVLQYNFEFLDYLQRRDLPRPTILAAPSPWRIDDVAGAVPLPVPVDLERFPPRERSGRAARFLHLVGRPAIHDRNGTADFVEALRYVRSTITVTIKCQDPAYVNRLPLGLVPENVTLTVDVSDTPNYWDNYRDSDVLVMPRRFGGLFLPINEALAAGMPTIMPDISPNNTWLPHEWLVPARRAGEFRARSMIELYTVDHQALAAKIDQFASHDAFFVDAQKRARWIAEQRSWPILKPVYERILRQAARDA